MIDVTGQQFARLTAIERGPDHFTPKGLLVVRWRCRCECGKETLVPSADLRNGKVRSCGCLARDLSAERCRSARNLSREHGHRNSAEGVAGTRTYRSWRMMLVRCYDPKHENYEYYGGRGIRVCDRWRSSFALFLEDMGERPEGKTLDRENGDGNYEPGNCRWATPTEQASNRRPRAREGREAGGRRL